MAIVTAFNAFFLGIFLGDLRVGQYLFLAVLVIAVTAVVLTLRR